MSQELKGTYKVFENVHELISGIWPTPLVKLSKFGNVWAKLEYYNALSQSIKDRFAWYVINKLIKSGELTNKVIYEASSGNFALALALLSKIYNFNLRIYLPKSTSRSVEILLKILGVDYVKTDFEVINQDFRNYVRKISEIKNGLIINQFENDDNPKTHYEYTGWEIIQQLKLFDIKIDVLIAGIGTGGHISGIAKKLREYYPKLKVIGVIPCKNNIIPGIKRIEYGVKWVHEVVDDVIEISVKEAIEGVIKLARAEGLLVGLSSGAVFRAFLKIREQIGLEKTYLLIFPDDIFKYLDILSEWIETFTDLST